MGSGRLLAALAERRWTVTGIDAAPGMVELSRARVSPANATLAAESAEGLSWGDGEFDAAVAVAVLEYTDIHASLRELVRVVRPGGRIVIGLRNRAAPVHAWRQGVTYPAARWLKRRARFGEAPPKRRRRPLSLRQIHELLSAHGLRVERVETVGAEVLPDPLDRLFPGLAYQAARRAEHAPRLRRILGSDRLILARRPIL